MPRSRSFTRLTMRVGLLHLGQSVDFVVSISFLRSPVFAILAIGGVFLLLVLSLHTPAWRRAASTARPSTQASRQINVRMRTGLANLSLHQWRSKRLMALDSFGWALPIAAFAAWPRLPEPSVATRLSAQALLQAAWQPPAASLPFENCQEPRRDSLPAADPASAWGTAPAS